MKNRKTLRLHFCGGVTRSGWTSKWDGTWPGALIAETAGNDRVRSPGRPVADTAPPPGWAASVTAGWAAARANAPTNARERFIIGKTFLARSPDSPGSYGVKANTVRSCKMVKSSVWQFCRWPTR